MFAKLWLNHESREAIWETIRLAPGLNQATIAELLELDPTTIFHHVEPMRNYGVVERRNGPRGNEKLHFAAEDLHLWEDERTRPLFGGGTTREIALYLHKHPGATVNQIADDLDMTPRSVYPYVQTLRNNGLIGRERIGHAYVHWAKPPLDQWVSEVGEAYEQLFGPPGQPPEDDA